MPEGARGEPLLVNNVALRNAITIWTQKVQHEKGHFIPLKDRQLVLQQMEDMKEDNESMRNFTYKMVLNYKLPFHDEFGRKSDFSYCRDSIGSVSEGTTSERRRESLESVSSDAAAAASSQKEDVVRRLRELADSKEEELELIIEQIGSIEGGLNRYKTRGQRKKEEQFFQNLKIQEALGKLEEAQLQMIKEKVKREKEENGKVKCTKLGLLRKYQKFSKPRKRSSEMREVHTGKLNEGASPDVSLEIKDAD